MIYEVDDKDIVVELDNVPQSSVGAPIPILVAGEHDVLITYYLQNTSQSWDGTTVKSVENDTEFESVAIVKFSSCYAHMFGPPNDEAFSGHPLSDRGLKPYSAFEIKNSSWLRRLEKINSVHPYHDSIRFMASLRHFVLSFHDTTFECIANGYEITISSGSVSGMVPSMAKHLW